MKKLILSLALLSSFSILADSYECANKVISGDLLVNAASITSNANQFATLKQADELCKQTYFIKEYSFNLMTGDLLSENQRTDLVDSVELLELTCLSLKDDLGITFTGEIENDKQLNNTLEKIKSSVKKISDCYFSL
jgi:hypothetical protein